MWQEKLSVTCSQPCCRYANLYGGFFIKIRKTDLIKEVLWIFFREFNIHSARNNWYLKLTLTVSTAMLIINLLNIPRAMWVGIACMSVCVPFFQ